MKRSRWTVRAAVISAFFFVAFPFAMFATADATSFQKGSTALAVLEKQESWTGSEEHVIENMAYMSPLVDDTEGVLALSFEKRAPLQKRSVNTEFDVQWNHGVASGDPLHDAVIIWTKVTLVNNSIKGEPFEQQGSEPEVTVKFEVSRTPDFKDVTSSGRIITGPDVDYVVKVDVNGLQPRTFYYYRFSVPGARTPSPRGRTKTFPHPDDQSVNNVDLIFASCANMPFGYFNAYKMMARREAEAVVFLGDYYYEYKDGFFGEGALLDPSRIPQPDKELATLKDFRMRHAQYKADEDLQAAHQAHPWIVIWDDHEFGDNAYSQGSLNTAPTKGVWFKKRNAALRAYFEYMPIRHVTMDASQKIYRKFSYGTLFDLIMLDTRMDERDVPQARGAVRDDKNRTMLGSTQVQWFKDQLTTSVERGASWRLVGNQVLFADVTLLKDDTWANYPAERERIMNHLKTEKIDNTVFLTGDVHVSLALDITPNPYNPMKYHFWDGEGSLAVEFVTPAITAQSVENKLAATAGKGAYRVTHPHLRYADLHRKGYCTITISRDRVVNTWWHMHSLKKADYNEKPTQRLEVLEGTNRIQRSEVEIKEVANGAMSGDSSPRVLMDPFIN